MELDFREFSNGYINTTDPEQPEWQGTGIFDELIKAINGNIKVQFDSGRIKGTEYADVYLGSLQTAMSEAMKFMLVKDLTEKDIELKEVEIANNTISGENLIKQGTLLDNQIEISNVDVTYKETNVIKDLEIKDKQIESVGVDIANNTISGENLIKQGTLLEEQIKTSYTDRVMKDKQTAMLGMDGIMKKQNLITDKDVVYTPKYTIQQG